MLFALAGCGPVATIPVLDSFPEGLLRVIGGHRHLTVEFKSDGYRATQTFLDSLRLAVLERRYFLSVERRERSGEAWTQSVAASPGQGAGVALLLLIDFPRKPDYSCNTYMTTHTEETCVQWQKKGKNMECVRKQKTTYHMYHAVDTFRLWTVANLMSVETSRSMTFTNTTPRSNYRSARNVPVSCLGYSAMADLAEKQVSSMLAARVSPLIADYRVRLYDGTSELPADRRAPVAVLLERGIRAFAAEPGQAARLWNEALLLSERRSASAAWNLAVYHWSVRNLKEAQAFFDSAMDLGGIEWLTRRRRETFNRFYRERMLIEKHSPEGL